MLFKKQCRLFQLFCSFTKPREVDTKGTYLNVVPFLKLQCHEKTVGLCLVRLYKFKWIKLIVKPNLTE